MRAPARSQLPILSTLVVGLILYVAAALRYPGFASWSMLVSLLRDNAFLGLTAIGMTFVIISGGIDLSVGAMVAFTSMLLARLIAAGAHPILGIAGAVLAGTCFGAAMGAIVEWFRIPSFLVTLAGMFLARGAAAMIDLSPIPIHAGFYEAVGNFDIAVFPATAILFLATAAAGLALARWTSFGRAVYALGGSEQSARLMGLPIAATRIRVFALSGFCAALAGVAYSFYTSSGNPSAGSMLELDAIAAVVIGGTPLTGGVGGVAGTLLGVLILGIIESAITFEGTLSSWWAKIAIGALLLFFILLQRFAIRRATGRSALG